MSNTDTFALTDYLVKPIGVLATAAKSREIRINGPKETSLGDLISQLVLKVNNPQFTDLLIDSATKNPLPNVIILLNDQDCKLFKGLETRLKPRTTITIIPVAHGG